MKHSLFAVMVAAAGAAAAGLVPEATFVGAEQGQDNVVRISYTLANAPAIVTLDVQTNGEDNSWTSIGALNVFGPKCSFVRGANTLVEGNGRHEIEWRPHKSWAIGGATVGRVRFALKAMRRAMRRTTWRCGLMRPSASPRASFTSRTRSPCRAESSATRSSASRSC